MPVNWRKAQRKAANTARWAVTMTKVRIRRVLARTRWQLVTFCGPSGGESVGIVDMLAIRKNHGKPRAALKRGDSLQAILIQVKGGKSAMPTADDAKRLLAVARWHRAGHVLLGAMETGPRSSVLSTSRQAMDGSGQTGCRFPLSSEGFQIRTLPNRGCLMIELVGESGDAILGKPVRHASEPCRTDEAHQTAAVLRLRRMS
jgi:hypothetical protein